MSPTVLTANEITLEQVLSLAQRLRPIDQARLAIRLAPKVEWALTQIEAEPTSARTPLRGLLSDLGAAPTAEEIDDVQREMWAGFAREDGQVCLTMCVAEVLSSSITTY